ncbi:YtpI family protein [Gracilibacillus alcaliphilus]|uniref:YtpI family protein n=1 Tax=Gracilibacillus alcaliphilus TaxID=1401441 RepID=UPI00195D3E44|nr:YtpI family protein [Gracilibacillus alcaliphilus]MBM7676896.1 putative membrane protein [Gracilibacillus alcaliphilus]
MIAFPIVIILSILLYIYYKFSNLRQPDPLIQEISNAKARIALGIFMIAFGINQYIFYQTQLALFVTIAFLAIGILQGYGGVKRYLHYKGELHKRK